MIPSYPKQYIALSKKRIPERYKLLWNYRKIVDGYEPEILKDYNEIMRLNLFKYILKDPVEWRRLNIQTFPVEYPVMVIRAPVPWHTQYNLGKHSLEKHFFIGNIVSLRIRELWEKK